MSPSKEPSTPQWESKVLELVNSYRSVEERHPLVDLLCSNSDSNNFFHETLNHDAWIISSRSQDIEDGEISIFQKAFLILSNNQPQDYNAVVAIWTDELFGFRAMPGGIDSLDILANLTAKVHAVHQMNKLLEAHVPEIEDRTVDSAAEDRPLLLSQETESHNEVHESPPNTEAGTPPDKAAETVVPKPFANDSKFQRLLETYHKARRDFDNATPRSRDRTAAARFLRDTSENCLNYLLRKGRESIMEALAHSSTEEINLDKAVVRELQDTIAETMAFVEGCSGGKKRSFDEESATDPATGSSRNQSKSASPKKPRRSRVKPVTRKGRTVGTPIRTQHMARQRAPSPENLRLGRHEVTLRQDRPIDDRCRQVSIHTRRGESGEMRTDNRFDDAQDRHAHRFDTARRPDFASGPFERGISEGRYPSYGFGHEHGGGPNTVRWPVGTLHRGLGTHIVHDTMIDTSDHS